MRMTNQMYISIMMVGCLTALSHALVVFEDTFPSTTIDTAKWSYSGASIDTVGSNEPSPSYSLRLNGMPSGGDTVTSISIDLSLCSEASLVYYYQCRGGGDSPESGDDLVISYYNGTSWIELVRHSGSMADMTTYAQSVIALPAGALHDGFMIRIQSSGTSSTTTPYDDWFVDDISLDVASNIVISGQIRTATGTGIEGVTVSADNGGSQTSSGIDGMYEVGVPPGWSGIVKPTRSGWLFTPEDRTYENVVSGVADQYFTGAPAMIISGYVYDAAGHGIEGVLVEGSAGCGSTTTASDGYYELAVLAGWSGTVWPSLTGTTFAPASRSYQNINGNQADQNYDRQPTLLYVDGEATGNDDGSSWDDAFIYLQDALASAMYSDEIWVAQGTYYPDQGGTAILGSRTETFRLKSGVAIYGGFVGTEVDRSGRLWEEHPTILSGNIGLAQYATDNSYHVVTGSGTDVAAVLDGFIVQDGRADGNGLPNDSGAGMYAESGRCTIRHCTFTNNYAASFAGAIYNNYGGVQVSDSAFMENNAVQAGAVYCGEVEASFTRCVFVDNTASNYGGAFYHYSYNYAVAPRLVGCRFYNNRAVGGNGGAIYSTSPVSADWINSPVSGLQPTATSNIRPQQQARRCNRFAVLRYRSWKCTVAGVHNRPVA